MFRYALLFVTALVLAGPARAATTAAEGLFDELKHDFGSVPHGQLLNHSFRVINNTKGPVRINHVRVSCDCTTARALSLATLQPGQETSIHVQMQSRRFWGVRAVTVFVVFDEPQIEEVRLIVEANSREDVAFFPDNLVFGKVKAGATPTAQMTINFLGHPQLQITEVRAESNYIQPKVAELRRDAGEVIYQVSAVVRPDIPEGKWYTDVWLTTNTATLLKLRIPLTIEVENPPPPAPATPATPAPTSIANSAPTPPPAPKAPPSPPSVSLGEVKAGMEVERKIILRGAQPFRIISVRGADREMIVHPTGADSKTVHMLTVTIRCNQVGQLVRNIHVQTDMENNSEIEFNAQLQVVP